MSPLRESFDGGKLARRSMVFSHPPALNPESPPMGTAHLYCWGSRCSPAAQTGFNELIRSL